MNHFDAPTVIRTKRDGGRLSDAAIDWVIDAYTDGQVADEQMSALLMAVFLRGMDYGETARWTAAMVASGERMDFTDLRRDGSPLKTVDKHSTGGVGDKITLPLVAVIAACGGAVPQASGRGLGHTGGTLDKLESIAGFTGVLTNAQVRQQLCDIGAAIFAAGQLAPADAKLYALRDITATVESLPLIASSVMSKKIAEGAGALVLDVKVGSGALVQSESRCRELAETMVALGAEHGLPTCAVLTDMNRPLGAAIGNALEVAEALEVLAGGGPPDVVELTVGLAREMLEIAGIDQRDPEQTLRDGTAMDRFRALIAAQGGDLSVPLPVGKYSETVTAARSGTMGGIDAMAVGLAVWRLGAGRSRPGEKVQPGAGIQIHRRPGEPVAAGEPLFTLYTDTPQRFPQAMAELDAGFTRHRYAAGRAATDHRSDHLMTTPLSVETIKRAPKALLHDHLDGGLRPATVIDIAGQTGYDGLPATDADELAQWFRTASHSGSLERYLEPFSHTVAVMQTPEALHRVAFECVEDLAADSVVYAEVRFAPELHINRGLSFDAVTDAVLAGFVDGEKAAAAAGHPIVVRCLVTAMRHAAVSREIAELAIRFRDKGVVGFDIAGAEAGYPPTRHLDAFEYMRNNNARFTIHAGEAFGLPSIQEAISFCGADRLGHGVRIVRRHRRRRGWRSTPWPTRIDPAGQADSARDVSELQRADRRGRQHRRASVRSAGPHPIPGHGQHRQPA